MGTAVPGRFAPNPVRPLSRFAPIPVRPHLLIVVMGISNVFKIDDRYINIDR